MIRYLLIPLLFVPLQAFAQVDLIVGVDPGRGGAVAAVLEGAAAKQGGAQDAALEEVVGVRPVFAARGAGKTGPPLQAYTLVLPDSAALERALARWAALPGVAYAHYNRRYRLDHLAPPDTPSSNLADDPLRDSLAHLDVIRVPEAWAVTDGQPDVRLGFVDTGVYFAHPDLATQFWINPAEDLNGDGHFDAADLNGVDDDGNGFVDDVRGYDFVDRSAAVEAGDYGGRDPDASEDDRPGGGRGHGTNVAGVLAAARGNDEGITGVAPGVRLVPLRAFGADGLGEDDDVAAAIVYAAEMGVDVLNLSFGDVYESPLMRESIAYAVSQGVVVVASGGNVGGDRPHYPSDYPDVVSVAWLDATGAGIAGRGSYGVAIDLGAPGSSVYTTLFPAPAVESSVPPDLYGRRSGSSVAAPMVAGAAALLRSIAPGLSPDAVRETLRATAVDVGEPGWDHRTGAGRLDVAAALGRALPAQVEITSPGHNAALPGAAAAVVGTVFDPAFAHFTVSYAPGDGDPTGGWTALGAPVGRQVLADTLAVWPVGDLPEGVYTLRLSVVLRTGKTVEDRRRVFVDRSAPVPTLHLLDDALAGDLHAVVADVATDDLTEAVMTVRLAGRTYEVSSDRQGRRHGLVWTDESRRGGVAQVVLRLTNGAGQSTELARDVVVPRHGAVPGWMTDVPLDVPHGYLLPHAVDFDRDGLREVVLNRYADGWVGDTLAAYEWDGAGFRLAWEAVANVIPRDVGDADGDGLTELLTQVGGATLLLEQRAPNAYPGEAIFVDTTGLANPFDDRSAFGAALTDLDGDGRGEVLVHNTRAWRVLEYDGATFRETARLPNPTGVSASEIEQNELQEPEVLVADLDGDGSMDVVAGDSDGDWIWYEAVGDDAFRVVWTYETPRYNAGSRFTHGDFDGDGRTEFVTFTHNWTQPTREGEYEPAYGRYFHWSVPDNDTVVLVDSFAVAGSLFRHGTLAAADFDRDGRDELVVVHPPRLYVLAYDEGDGWRLRHTTGAGDAIPPAGVRSIAVATGDWDGDGHPELVAAGADERLHRFVPSPGAAARPALQWVNAYAADEATVVLSWHAPAVDSVTVFSAAPGGTFDPLATTPHDTLVVSTSDTRVYALQAWRGGEASVLSPARTVRPHPPAVVVSITFPEPATVALRFSERLAPGAGPARFRLGDGLGEGTRPDDVLPAHDGYGVILRFSRVPPGRAVLHWEALRDEDGTPVPSPGLALDFPAPVRAALTVASWEVVDARTVAVTFNEPLDAAVARQTEHYEVWPAGVVVAATVDEAVPERLVVQFEGLVIGATGLETTLVLDGLRGRSGAVLPEGGQAVRLVEAAGDLQAVYAFPNPCRVEVHGNRMMVAGLPVEATVRILSAQGVLVRVLEERDGDGGVAWDLTDRDGAPVPSGVYLLRVEAEGLPPVLHKAAVIR